jgi:hypothetical protein
MRQLPIWLWSCAGGSAFLIFSLGALLYGNEWWLSGIVTVTLLVWLAGLLALIYSPAAQRPMLAGALAASFLYLLFALGPWFNSAVGPWLLTTRALTNIETQWLMRDAQQPQVVYQMVPSPYIGAGNSTVWTSAGMMPGGYSGPSMYPGYVTTSSYVPVATGPSTFVTIGHWLCGWVAAIAGALAAGWISRRGRRIATTQGENPFAQPVSRRMLREAAPQGSLTEAVLQDSFTEAVK